MGQQPRCHGLWWRGKYVATGISQQRNEHKYLLMSKFQISLNVEWPQASNYTANSLTNWNEMAVVLQCNIPVQGPLARIQVLPFLLGEAHNHILKWHWSLEFLFSLKCSQLGDTENDGWDDSLLRLLLGDYKIVYRIFV
jgi:hypothetical protein